MKKNLFLLSSVMMVSLLLTACLSPEEEEVTEPVESTEQAPSEEQSTPDESETTEPAGTLTQSDGQNYELYVLDGYELFAEEPGKDSLQSVNNDTVFMRVETFPLEDADYEFAVDTMIQTLSAVNPGQEPAEVAFDHADAKQATASSVPSSEGTVTGIVYELDNSIVRLTIFDDSTVNATEDFIAMGKTIHTLQ